MTPLKKYWLFSLLGMVLVSCYPLYMGFRVIYDMILNGTVYQEDYPKYIIPYTPISLAVIAGAILLPLLVKYIKKYSLLAASFLSLCIFFLSELLLESKVVVTSTVTTTITLKNWQMYMCFVPPERYITRTWETLDVLSGQYSPMFKLHFYLISVVLIVSILNCLYGFAWMIDKKDCKRCKSLVVQSVCTALFLGLCILACFTAFFRDGELIVSAESAILMILFFVVLGVTAGTYTGSFLLGRKKSVSVMIPSVTASLITLLMYIGEMFLLSGNLYRFGTGILSQGIFGIVLAPIDILVILFSGILSGSICCLLNPKKK